jgi:hypothetical protein
MPVVRPVLVLLAWFGLACSAQAGEVGPQLPSLALNPPPPPASSELYNMRQFSPYAAPGVGSATPNSGPGDARASQAGNKLVNSSSTPKPGPGGLDYDLGNNLHMHLSIAGAAAAGGVIRP